MILAINFDGVFEKNAMVLVAILLAIVAVRLYWLRPKKNEFAGMQGEELIDEWVGRRHQKDPFDDSVRGDSIHDESMCHTPGGTEIVPGAKQTAMEQPLPPTHETTVPLLRRLRYQEKAPAQTGQAAESYRAAEQRRAVELYENSCINPYDSDLIAWVNKVPGDRKKLDLANVLPDLSDGAASALIRIFATEGGEAELAQAFAIRPALNDAAFKDDMQIFYTDMLRMLEGIDARHQIALWQRMLGTLK